MKQQTTVTERQEMYRRHTVDKQTYDEIGTALGRSKECVRYWCRRQRDHRGCCSPRQHAAAPGALSRFDPQIAAQVIALKVTRTRLGAGYIAQLLQPWREQEGLAGLQLPSRATVGRFLQAQPGVAKRKAAPLVAHPQAPPTATRPHECWALDFKMGIELADHSLVNLHTLRDVAGECCIAACLTPAGSADRPSHHPSRVTFPQVQTTVRRGMGTWSTLPKAIQTDNEALLVGHADDDFPSRFTLWLWLLGIEHRTTRPHRPTDNAEVERCHQTINNYVIVGQEQLSMEQLQQALNQAIENLFSLHTSQAAGCQGQTPAQAHPQLLAQPRPWSPDQEYAYADLDRVYRKLACLAWRRHVGASGQVSIGGRHYNYTVGQAHAGEDVLVAFDPTDHTFVFFSQQPDNPDLPAEEIMRRKARFLTKERIIGPIEPILPDTLPHLPFPPAPPSDDYQWVI